tara:strand:- start:21505 stop:21999 length:495 start_codon:yes stop_codon:yes gene_type:complete
VWARNALPVGQEWAGPLKTSADEPDLNGLFTLGGKGAVFTASRCHIAFSFRIAVGKGNSYKGPDLMSYPVYWLIHNVIFLFQIVIFVYLITRILIQFDVVNAYNQFVQFILRFGGGLVEPALAPIRRFVPQINGIDLSPIVLLLGLGFIDIVAAQLLVRHQLLG